MNIILFQRWFMGFEQTTKAVRHFSHTRTVLQGLKIAYFGTDKFSVASLSKLQAYKQAKPDSIESIHVITRSVKPRGRKSKFVTDLPIANYCTDSGDLPVIRADSLKEIEGIIAGHDFDLAVAVSYGKLIPRPFLESCKFGGLNVHPSLLPRYTGSSPIQYALMNDDKYSGCTIQTLHPTKFDHGDIIMRSEEIPILESDNYSSLQLKLGHLGGDLLIKVIDRDLFKERMHGSSSAISNYEYTMASKITTSRHQIHWDKMTSRQIKRLSDALGSLHTYKLVDITKKKQKIIELRKVILYDITEVSNLDIEGLLKPGRFWLQTNKSLLIVKTSDGYIGAKSLKFECCNEEMPQKFMEALNKRCGSTTDEFVTLDNK